MKRFILFLLVLMATHMVCAENNVLLYLKTYTYKGKKIDQALKNQLEKLIETKLNDKRCKFFPRKETYALLKKGKFTSFKDLSKGTLKKDLQKELKSQTIDYLVLGGIQRKTSDRLYYFFRIVSVLNGKTSSLKWAKYTKMENIERKTVQLIDKYPFPAPKKEKKPKVSKTEKKKIFVYIKIYKSAKKIRKDFRAKLQKELSKKYVLYSSKLLKVLKANNFYYKKWRKKNPTQKLKKILSNKKIDALVLGILQKKKGKYRYFCRIFFSGKQSKDENLKRAYYKDAKSLEKKALAFLRNSALYKSKDTKPTPKPKDTKPTPKPKDTKPIPKPPKGKGWFQEKLPKLMVKTDLQGLYKWKKDRSLMVYVKQGAFLMGKEFQKKSLKSYYVDKHEVTNQQYCKFLNAVKSLKDKEGNLYIQLADPYCCISRVDGIFRAKPGAEYYPVIKVSWYGADAYAKWAGKRLPSELQWEKASRGGMQVPHFRSLQMVKNKNEKRIYPWGNQEPNQPFFRANFQDWHKKVPNKYRWLVPVSYFEGLGDSPYGCSNMSGNVREWCLDLDTTSKRVCRGGSWGSLKDTLSCSYRYSLPSQATRNDVGFRCIVEVD